jgi:hypothetical protein
VYLEERLADFDPLYSYGFSEKRYGGGDEVTFTYEAKSWLDGPRYLLKFREGQAQAGLSGAPLVNARSGTVCGVVQQTRNVHSDLGGRAIPTSALFQTMPELVEAQRQFHREDTRWLNCLDERQRRDLTGVSPTTVGKRPVRVVDLCSDNPRDLRLRQELLTQLALLRRRTEMVFWYERDIAPGKVVKVERRRQVEEADMILLLVSPDFLASDELDELMRLAMQRRSAQVIPVRWRPVDDWESLPFGDLRSLPISGRFVGEAGQKKDAELASVAWRIRGMVEEIWEKLG